MTTYSPPITIATPTTEVCVTEVYVYTAFRPTAPSSYYKHYHFIEPQKMDVQLGAPRTYRSMKQMWVEGQVLWCQARRYLMFEALEVEV